jgi:pilus assembly protein FimV
MSSRGERNGFLMAAVLALVLIPAGAYSLGLGEARVESYLNQPLDVRMRLLDASADDLDSLTVAPASPDDFERLGMSSRVLALDLSVTVDRGQSPPVIRVTSDRAVTDPVVQVLIDARWSSGRMLREYTLFLDPATVEVAPPPAEPARDEAAEPAPRPAEPEPAAAPAAPAQRPEPARVRAAQGGRYGPVARGETLWSIARANRPASDVTMDQMMIAIVELNPSAFRDGNINRLLRGAELELPDAERARALDPAEAAAAVAAQNRAFRRGATADTPVVSDAGRDVEPEPEAAAPSDAAAGSAGAEPRLSLVPPGDDEEGTGADGDGAEVDALRQQLARAEEELYAARQEAEEFRSRVEELESLVRDNPGGLGLQDAELAGLEETLRAAREATSEGADPALRADVSERLGQYLDDFAERGVETGADPDAPGADTEAAADDEALAETAGGAEPIDDAEPTAGPTADAQAEAEAESETGTEPTAAESSRRVTEVGSGDGLWANPMTWLVVALVVLVLVAFGLRVGLRRRREEARAREQPLKRAADVPPSTPAAHPVDEARSVVTRRPDDLAAHLALLKTLASDGREEEFGAALEAMFEHVSSGNEPEWREAVELAGRLVPGHPLVKGSADWVSDAAADADEPRSEIDQESEVDDLMSRLDADLEETDDSDWLETDAADETPDRGPLLREHEGASEDTPGDDEATVAFEHEPESEPKPEPLASEEDDDLIVDWPEPEGGKRAETGPGATGAESTDAESTEPEPVEESADGDDIFSQTDDDIDVKLDLAKAYLSWNSADSARTLLEEVVREGNDAQRDQARKLLDDLDGGAEG